MKTTLIVLALLAGIILAPLGMDMAGKAIVSKVTSQSVDKTVVTQDVPKSVDSLEVTSEVKLQAVKKIITLEDQNAVSIRGPITGSSVAKAIKQLQEVSRKVSKTTPIFLILDTPGGDIVAGTDLIDFAKALPQKVHTITLFAASMGFQIVQNLDTRYIVTNGQLMSHRARVSGVSGQIKGEFESRYKMIRRSIDALDFIASKRMGIDVKTYENQIFNEYWVYGFDAVAEKAADEEVLIRCGESLDGSDIVQFETMFGNVDVTFSKCPLIKAPEKINFSGLFDRAKQQEVQQVFNLAFEDKPRFVREYIITDRFFEFFK